MIPRKRLLRMYRGDASTFPFKVTDVDANGVEAPVNLTGSTFTFTTKRREDDTAVLFTVAGTITNAVNGEAEVRLTVGNTASLTPPVTVYWDLQMTGGAGDPHTIDAGYLLVEPDITT